LAVGAVGADEDGGAKGFDAVGGGDVELDVVVRFAEGGDVVDLAELDAAALARGEEGLLEAEVVEALAHGHGADGVARLYADIGGARVACLGFVGGLKHDLVADALDDGVYGVAEGFEGLAGEAAGTGFGAWEAALVEQDDMLAGLREVVRGGAAGRSCADDQYVNFANHWYLAVYSCGGVGYETDGGDRLREEHFTRFIATISLLGRAPELLGRGTWMSTVVAKELRRHWVIHNSRPRIRCTTEKRGSSVILLAELRIKVKVGR
jgi:hypothetical protein